MGKLSPDPLSSPSVPETFPAEHPAIAPSLPSAHRWSAEESGELRCIAEIFLDFRSGVEIFPQPSHRNPLSSDNLVDCQSFLRVGLQASLGKKCFNN